MALVVGGVLVATTAAASAVDLEPVPVKASPTINEYNAAAGGSWFAWSQNSTTRPNRYNFFVRRGSGPMVRVNARGTDGNGGGIDGRITVYSQWDPSTRGEDIYRFNLATKKRTRYPRAVNTKYWEYRPTISGRWLLFNRHNWSRNRLFTFQGVAGV